MLVVAGWFRTAPIAAPGIADQAADDARQERVLRACRDLAGGDWAVHDLRGDGWGFVVVHAPAPSWLWPFVAGADPAARLLTLSVGVPVGTEAATPEQLATSLLTGDTGPARDVLADVVPPFALVTVDRQAGRAAVQQDWLGMARLFTRTNDGVLALSTRPSLVPVLDQGSAAPDLDGWAGFASTGAYCGDDAPVLGVRLLAPGERVALTRREGVWEAHHDTGWTLDDLVRAGQEQRGRAEAGDLGVLADQAARGITRAAASLGRIYSGPIHLGLSGGKDSRMIAAALVAAGMTPVLSTNTTTRAEGETAARLVELVRARRGVRLEHRLSEVATPANVLTQPLLERAERLRRLYDDQAPSTYLSRSAVNVVPGTMRAPSFLGAGGEILTGYWHPRGGDDDMTRILLEKSCVIGSPANLSAAAREAYTEKVGALAELAAKAGLEGADVTDYAFLATRMRRWNTAGYHPGMVAPFLAPELVSAAFALSGEQKAAKALHMAVLDRLVPEWTGVPFVSIGTGRNRATRIWDGDGLATLEVLAARDPGALASMIDRGAVKQALKAAVTPRPPGAAAKILEQFVALAVADAGYGTGPALPDPASMSVLGRARLRASIRRASATPARVHALARGAARRARRLLR